jgi:heme exporter protein A
LTISETSRLRSGQALHLRAQALACVRGGRRVFENLSFELAGGEALVLTGPNGSGKSSLIRQIAGLVEIAGGSLALEGGDDERGISEQAHYVGHLDALKNAMSVRETMLFWADFLGGTGDAEHALDALGLGGLCDLPVAYLSAGQRRRLALSRLFLAPRPLWLLDEPSVGLDAASVERLALLMKEHLAAGGLIVAATHQELGLDGARRLELTVVRNFSPEEEGAW